MFMRGGARSGGKTWNIVWMLCVGMKLGMRTMMIGGMVCWLEDKPVVSHAIDTGWGNAIDEGEVKDASDKGISV